MQQRHSKKYNLRETSIILPNIIVYHVRIIFVLNFLFLKFLSRFFVAPIVSALERFLCVNLQNDKQCMKTLCYENRIIFKRLCHQIWSVRYQISFISSYCISDTHSIRGKFLSGGGFFLESKILKLRNFLCEWLHNHRNF